MDPGDPIGSFVKKWNNAFLHSNRSRKKAHQKRKEAADYYEISDKAERLYNFIQCVGERKKFKGNGIVRSEFSKSEIESIADEIDSLFGNYPMINKSDILDKTDDKKDIVTDYYVYTGYRTGILSRQDVIEIIGEKKRIITVVGQVVLDKTDSREQSKRVMKKLYNDL